MVKQTGEVFKNVPESGQAPQHDESSEETPPKKKKKKRGVVRSIGRVFINPSRWFNVRPLIDYGKSMYDMTKDNFSVSELGGEQGFEHMVKRHGLTEEALKQKLQVYQRYRNLLFSFAICIVLYAFYLLFTDSFVGFLIALIVSVLGFSRAYLYSFWAFQIQHRKLGCTFAEWRAGKV